jgi:hypothetical protein
MMPRAAAELEGHVVEAEAPTEASLEHVLVDGAAEGRRARDLAEHAHERRDVVAHRQAVRELRGGLRGEEHLTVAPDAAHVRGDVEAIAHETRR